MQNDSLASARSHCLEAGRAALSFARYKDCCRKRNSGSYPAAVRPLSRVLFNQAAQEREIAAHVGFHRLRRRIRLEIGVAAVIDGEDGMHQRGKINLTLAKIVWIVLEMELADAFRSQPADLLDRVESGLVR